MYTKIKHYPVMKLESHQYSKNTEQLNTLAVDLFQLYTKFKISQQKKFIQLKLYQ